MLLFRRSLAVLVLCLSVSAQAQKTWPSTMLWRITGNGLSKPSYLFGTMHVQDKRLFQFTDSLYHFIGQADGFAIEVDFQEYMDSLMNRTILRKQQDWLEEQRDERVVDTRSVSKEADTLLHQLGMDRKTLTAKQLRKIRDYRISRLAAQGEMPTIVDAYLLGLARRQGKWTGGIEDVLDQMDVMNELGQSINPAEVFTPDKELRLSVEQMKQVYLKEDLQRIAELSYADTRDPYTQRMLIQRNIKMARRMDSLTKYRSMFFAVGAAHLPSDSGVIALLRKRGYRVEPVFSNKRMSAETVAARLDELAWKPVQDEEKLFTVEMPGTPSAFNVFGNVVKMNMYFDVTTMTMYMAGSTLAEARSQSDLNELLTTIASQQGMGNSVKNRKNISSAGLNGVEGMLENGDGVYRVRLLQKGRVLYLLMTGSNRKENLGPQADRFFRSFVAHEPTAKSWSDLVLAAKGVRIAFPGQPKRNAMLESAGNSSNWTFTAYDYMDVAHGLYFLFHVRETGPGYNIDGDSTYFEAFQEQLSDKYDSVLRKEIGTYQGFPAYHLWVMSRKGKLVYRTLNVLRGNRVYVLMVGMTENSEAAVADRFLNSLQMIDYPARTWSQQTSIDGGFRSVAAVPFQEAKDEEDEVEEDDTEPQSGPYARRHFYAYDSVQVVSLDVFRTPLPPFYWSKDDSTFLSERSSRYYSEYTDTVLFSGPVMVGNLKGWEVRYRANTGGQIKKIRVVVSRDTLYELFTVVPSLPGFEQADRFFTEFRVAREQTPTIYTRRVPALLQALRSGDEAEREQAVEVFSEVEFETADLPLLREALLVKYGDEEEGLSMIRSNILDELVDLDDADSVARFVRAAYPALKPGQEQVKYTLLTLLAQMDRDTCWSLTRELLARGLPKEGNPRRFIYSIRSHTGEAARLLPMLINGSTDSLHRELIAELAYYLDEDSLLDRSVFRPYMPLYLADAEASYRYVKANTDEGYMAYEWARFVSLFGTPECLALQRKFLAMDDMDLRFLSLIGLLRHQQKVDPAMIGKVAADKAYRVDLYEKLEAKALLAQFPKAWASQRLLAESEIYGIASEELEEVSVDFIGERIEVVQGKKQKFLLFRVHGEDEAGYLGVAGPYAIDAKKPVPQGKSSGLFWEEDYDKNRINEQFRKYLAEYNSEETEGN